MPRYLLFVVSALIDVVLAAVPIENKPLASSFFIKSFRFTTKVYTLYAHSVKFFNGLIHFYQRDIYHCRAVYKNLVFFEITGRSLAVVVAEAERLFGYADRIRV